MKNKKIKFNKYLLCVPLLVLLIFLSIRFLTVYQDLNRTLESERTTYVDELAVQQYRKILTIQQENMLFTNVCADFFEIQKPDTFEEVSQLFRSAKEDTSAALYMVSSKGHVYDLNGTQIIINDKSFLLSLMVDHEPISEFKQVSLNHDYWIFGVPIEPLTIENTKIVALLRAFPIDFLADALTITMFQKQASSYIVLEDGNILLRPSEANVGFGYNLCNSMIAMGADSQLIKELNDAFLNKRTYSDFITFKDQTWLVSAMPLDDMNQSAYSENHTSAFSVLVVPASLIAAQSYSEMNQLIFSLSLVFAAILALMIWGALLIIGSARKRREEEYELRLREQAAQSKTDFLTKMSHDIRTPLNGIIGMNYIVKTQIDPSNTEALASLDQISTSADYLLSILNDVLNMSKIESGRLTLSRQPFSVDDLLSNIQTLILPTAHDKGLDFHLITPREMKYDYIGDELRINQVLMNLLSNAVKFTKDGSVTLEVRFDVQNDTQDLWTLVVTDTGIGMTESYMRKLFTPFLQEDEEITSAYGGSGLGLSIVKNLVDLMGGSITVKSEKGRGSQFTVALPLERAEKAKKSTAETRSEPRDMEAIQGKRVLLVEDHPINAMITKKLLERFNLQVDVASDGKLGLEAFVSSEKGYYSLILMDIRMPNMNGYEATKAIRSSAHPEAKTIPICAMSANVFDDDVAQSLSSGMNEHLKKPVEIDKLTAAILKYINP